MTARHWTLFVTVLVVGGLAVLCELAAFCTASDDTASDDKASAYAWWRAPAWSGKSALMAWFALHPPDGVRIVPFFITSRWGGYSDWRSFADIRTLSRMRQILGEDDAIVRDVAANLAEVEQALRDTRSGRAEK